MVYLLEMVIFYSYVKLPEGIPIPDPGFTKKKHPDHPPFLVDDCWVRKYIMTMLVISWASAKDVWLVVWTYPSEKSWSE